MGRFPFSYGGKFMNQIDKKDEPAQPVSFTNQVAALNALIMGLRAELKAIKDKYEPEEHREEIIELVALPGDSKTILSKRNHAGKQYFYECDSDGFFHIKVPKSYAVRLLPETGGLKHVLVGPVDKIEIVIPKGMHSEKKSYPRHSKRKTSSGAFYWVPVIVEDPTQK
jgi:hypothetical protein